MAAELVAEEGILKGLILILEHGEEWTIGRDPESSSVVIEDPQVSRAHVRIWKQDDRYYAQNLSETNPVLVDNEPLEETPLQDKCLLTIGSSKFRFYEQGLPYLFSVDTETHPDFDEEPQAFEEKKEDETPQEERLEEEEKEIVAEDSDYEEEISEEPYIEEEEVYEEPESSDVHIDLTASARYILKVISGPNTGAEFSLDLNRTYLIGTDGMSCDIVFNDLSISREHARLKVGREGEMTIEDNNSRNGVLVDRERVSYATHLGANSVVQLGTSAFLIIDREAPAQTIAAQFEEKKEEEPEVPEELEVPEITEPIAAKTAAPKKPLPIGALIITLMISLVAVLFGIATVSLLQTKNVVPQEKNFKEDIAQIVNKYPAVRFTYNEPCSRLFLLGHVQTGVEHNELLYQLKGLGFISGIDDNIVNDEAVWQEMNILLSKHPDFKGVSMHSPESGVFVINGYLATEKQSADLTDYLNVNFNYLSRLQNRVVVEESVKEETASMLIQNGFGSVNAAISNGDLLLTGYISKADLFAFEKMVEDFKKIPGVRNVRNFVVSVTPEQRVIDLNKKYENKTNPEKLRYKVTGYSKHGDVNVNVVINGRIIGRGDCLDGYTITSIQPHSIFMEKDGLKYKIEYNKCNAFGSED